MKTKFPENLAELSTEALEALKVEGLAEFDSLYTEDFASASATALSSLDSLSVGLTAVKDELSARAERAGRIASLAAGRDEFARVTGTFEAEVEDEVTAAVEEEVVSLASDVVVVAGGSPDAIALGAETEEQVAPAVAYATGEGLGVAIDTPLTMEGVGKALDKRLAGFNVTPYQNAARTGRALKQVQHFAAFTRDIPEEVMVREGSKNAIRKAIDIARDQSRLPKGSLIASGGWGAPSRPLYDPFRKLSSQDGIASFPEIGVDRGGVLITPGTSFSEVYSNPNFISFTEEQDIAGEYATDSSGDPVEGTKPVYRITPGEWEDYRLQVDGVHVQAGILESRGYPEGISSEVAQILDAHAHKINGKALAAVAAGSTTVTLPATQVGATAPILTAIELQVLHYRDTHRMLLDSTLEAKFPHWTKGAIRGDLARRLGVDLIDVPDSRIIQWFNQRGVSVEFVYDWQSVATTAASAFTSWPTTVSFQLYAAGTWVKGVSPVISLDTMYDSTLLGTNDYTVLFTEEGWFVAKAGHDSRLVTVSISATGAANIGAEIAANGTAA